MRELSVGVVAGPFPDAPKAPVQTRLDLHAEALCSHVNDLQMIAQRLTTLRERLVGIHPSHVEGSDEAEPSSVIDLLECHTRHASRALELLRAELSDLEQAL